MAYGGGDAGAACIVESHNAAVAERELYLALALLARHFAGNRAVNLVGEPILAGHGLEREHIAHICGEIALGVFRSLV